MNRIALGAALALLVGSAGCATIHMTPEVSKLGPYDGEGEKEIVRKFQEAAAEEIRVSPEEVTVLVNSFPAGIRVDGTTVSVQDGYDHKLIAQFSLATQGFPIQFLDYKSGWRKGYCYPQVPLGWVTLTIWNIFSPLNWPCHGSYSTEKVELIENARRLAAAAGGDLVVMEFQGVSGRDHASWGRGFIISRDPRTDPGRAEPIPSQPMEGPPSTF